MKIDEIKASLYRLLRDAEGRALRHDSRTDPAGYGALVRSAATLADLLLQASEDEDGGPPPLGIPLLPLLFAHDRESDA